MKLSLEKVEERAPELLSLVKEAKSALGDLINEPARVALILDNSISMNRMYDTGQVQTLAERALAAAACLDDDGEIDVFCFDTSAAYLGSLNLDNYKKGVDRLLNGRRRGSTNYAAAFREVASHYNLHGTEQQKSKGLFGFGKKKVESSDKEIETLPVFAIFVTDGTPNSAPEASTALIKASETPIFWKFLSVGNEKIKFLELLDEMDGRLIDNANYQRVGNLSSVSSEQLLQKIVVEYGDFLKAARKAGILK